MKDAHFSGKMQTDQRKSRLQFVKIIKCGVIQVLYRLKKVVRHLF